MRSLGDVELGALMVQAIAGSPGYSRGSYGMTHF